MMLHWSPLIMLELMQRKLFYLDADIHEIRLWQIVKTEEISQNSILALTGKETGLTSNWVFDMSVLDTLNTIVVNKF